MLSRSIRRALVLGLLLVAAIPATAAAAPAEYSTPGTTGVPPAPPTTAPFVTGTPQVGGTLTGNRGTWDGSPRLSSEWLRCNDEAQTCETTGETDTTYRPTEADVGLTVKLRVVATRVAAVTTGTRTVDAASNPIAGRPDGPVAPLNVVRPTATGDAREGHVVGVNLGQWTGTEPISYTYGWASCPASGACKAVGTASTYTVKASDVGHRLLLAVSARNAAGGSAAFVQTGIVIGQTTGLKRLSPFPTLLIDGRVAGAITRISTLRLRRVPGGSTVNMACSGRGCPFRKSKIRVRKGKSRTVTLRRLQRRMRSGSKVVITVRKGNTIGKYIRLRLRRRAAPARVDRCVVPKSSKPIQCR